MELKQQENVQDDEGANLDLGTDMNLYSDQNSIGSLKVDQALPQQPSPEPGLETLQKASPGVIIQEKSNNPAALILLALALSVPAVIHVTGSHENPVDNLVEFYREVLGEDIEPDYLAAEETEVENIIIDEVPEDVPPALIQQGPEGFQEDVPLEQELSKTETEADPTVLSNPYWQLSNALIKETNPTKEKPTSAAEESLRVGLSHEFNYQRFKAIRTIRQSKWQGMEALLYEALDQPKLWHRMEAVIGLAEFGFEIDIETVEKALGDSRPALRKNYVKRFYDNRTLGETFVLKQMIRVVDAPTRLEILKALSNPRTPENELYLAAAQNDPSPSIQRWLTNELQKQPLATETINKYQDLSQKPDDHAYDLVPKTIEISNIDHSNIEEDNVSEIEFIEEIAEDDFVEDK